MKSQRECQMIVDGLETKFDLLVGPLPTGELIFDLQNYVDASDRVGVISHPNAVARKLKTLGYRLLDQLTAEERASNLFLCIVGNFLASNGAPPPNVMAHFCEEYLQSQPLPNPSPPGLCFGGHDPKEDGYDFTPDELHSNV